MRYSTTMARKIRKYIHSFIDDRFGKAKARYYFRRRGFKQVSLPGMPGSLEFEAAYAAALNNTQPVRDAGNRRVRAGSLGALLIAYLNSPGFLALSQSSRAQYRLVLEAFAHEHGDKPLVGLGRKHLQAMLARKMTTPAAANKWLRLIKGLMHFAQREGMRHD